MLRVNLRVNYRSSDKHQRPRTRVSAPHENHRTLVLAELRLENYAVIDNVVIEFAAGLNLLTGETGAGKSILIDALGLLLGEKASTDVIRTGAERAVVAAVFESDGRSFVYLQSATGFVPADIKVVRRNESQVVLTGIKDGDLVAMASPDQQNKKAGSSNALQAIPK